MKFSALVAIVPEDKEQACIDAARDLGAGGITVMSGRGISNNAKKTFFGLTFEGSQSVLLMVLEKKLSIDIFKALQHIIKPGENDSKGLVFTVPLEHLGGIDMSQYQKFEQHLKEHF